MADERPDLEHLRDAARRAREEAMRLRREMRDLQRNLRHEARTHAREARHHGPGAGFAPGPRFAPGPPPRETWGPSDRAESGEGASSRESFAMEGVREVSFTQTAGKAVFRPCTEDEQPGVVVTGNKSAPSLTVRRDGDRLLIDISLSKGWLFRRRQGASTVVRLSREFESLKIDVGYGEVQVREIQCRAMKVSTGAGEIGCFSTRGALDADVGAGKIGVHDHAGTVRCDSGTGDVVVDVAEAAPGEYRLNVGMGRAELRLPPGLEVYARAKSGIGKGRVDYPVAGESAAIRATVDAGIGEAVVKARVPGRAPEQPPAAPARGTRGAPAPRRREAEELRVLQLLEQGRITAQEAADLIAALQGQHPPATDADEPAAEDQPPAGTPSAE